MDIQVVQQENRDGDENLVGFVDYYGALKYANGLTNIVNRPVTIVNLEVLDHDVHYVEKAKVIDFLNKLIEDIFNSRFVSDKSQCMNEFYQRCREFVKELK